MAESLLNFLKISPKSLKLNKYLGYTPPPKMEKITPRYTIIKQFKISKDKNFKAGNKGYKFRGTKE